MAVDNRSTSALFKRAEQLRRWQDSETNKQELTNNKNRKVNFSDGCIFLAACAAGDKQEVLRLLEKGADIDTANVDGLTALHAACIDDNLDMVEFLVNQGADVNRGDMEGWTPLHATASCGFNSIAKFLIDRDADLSLVNNDGDLAIDIADSDEMETLLQREIDSRGIDCVASRNEEERRMVEDAQRWLSAGYLADRPHPKTGASALHVAAAKGYIKVMSLLLEAGSDINAQDLDGWTPLHAASHWCQRDAVEILCENMADMEKQNFVGQTAFDVADSSLLRLMDELKRKQTALKLVNQNKQTPRKRKTSPHRDHSNKKEREDQRESDGTSGDDSSSDVEKKNKVNKEKTPQIIPTSPDKNNTRAVPQAKAENTMDESEVQSWRRPSSLRKSQQDEKNQEVSRTISTSARVNNKESEETTAKRLSLPEKDESSLSATRERLKARSCPVLSQLEEEEVRGGGGGEGGGVWPQSRPHSRAEGIPTPFSSSISPLVKYQRLSSSDLNIPGAQSDPNSSQSSTSTPKKINNHLISPAFAPLCTSLTYSPAKTTCVTKTNVSSTSPHAMTCTSDLSVDTSLPTSILVPTNVTTTVPSSLDEPTASSLYLSHKPLGSSMSTPVLSNPGYLSSVTSPLPTSISPSSTTTTTTVTTSTTAGLASLSTNLSTNNKDPRLLARSASLRERIQRNHVDSMARVTPIPEPLVSSSTTVLTNTNTSAPVRSIGRSFVPPSRDEESETQRKAHAKMVRSTRRSTQGVTLEDIKSAEQLMKNKQQQATTSSPESKETSSSAPNVSTSIPQGATTTTTSPSSPTKADDEERRPSWRLKVDDADKTKFCLENVRSKDKPDEECDTVTVQLRKKNTEDKVDEDQKDIERSSQTREGTQAAIQRRKKPKRRSTGRVQVNMDEIDPEKRAQRLAEQQLQQQSQDDNGSDEGDEEDDSSVSEKGETTKGSTTSLGSSALNSRPSSRGSSVGPENGDIDYKKLYEEQLEENFRVHERLRGAENEVRASREAIELNNKKNNTRLAMAEADKREKRALERKLSEMEEELKLLEQLKQENQRLKDENGALIRVISKLSK